MAGTNKKELAVITFRALHNSLTNVMRRGAYMALLIVIVAATSFYTLTFREGMTWDGDDQGMYLMHAQNIVSGRSYADTNYIYNPDISLIGPRLFPPVWPALLAIPVSLHGNDLETIKLYMIAIFAVILLLTYVLALRRLDVWTAILPVTILAISPFLWDFKENLLSEFSFAALVLAALNMIERLSADVQRTGKDLVVGGASGLLIALSCGARAIGIVFAPVLLFYDVVKYRRVRLITIWVLAVAGLGLGLLLLTGNFLAAYGNLSFGSTPGARIEVGNYFTPKDFIDYFRAATALWSLGPTNPITYILNLIVLSAGVIGFLRSFVERFSVTDVFVLGYSSAIIVLPFDPSLRLVLPILPLLAIYVVYASSQGLGQMLDPFRHWILIATCICLTVLAIASHRTLSYAAFDEGPLSSEAQAMLSSIKDMSSENSVLTFRKPRLLASLAERPVVSFAFDHYFNNTDPKFSLLKFEKDLALFGIDFVVVDSESDNDLRAALADCRSLFERKARHGPYEIYKVRQGATCGAK